MAINLDALLISVIVNTIVVSPSLWLAGRLVVGGKNARFFDAVWIVIAGVVLGAAFRFLFTGAIATLIQLIIWLGLVKHFFEATWGQAIVVAILAVIIFAIASIVLGALLGLAIFSLLT